MKVMLTQDVDELGLAGEVKEVANGFGRNYLIPRGLAVLATAGALKHADVHRRRAVERRQRIADEMAALAEIVRQTKLVFQAKAGDKGRLYGSVTTTDIADKLSAAVEHEIDRRKINLDSPIKQLGTHKVALRLAPNLVADFAVVVESLDADDTIGDYGPSAASEDVALLTEAAEVGEAPDEE